MQIWNRISFKILKWIFCAQSYIIHKAREEWFCLTIGLIDRRTIGLYLRSEKKMMKKKNRKCECRLLLFDKTRVNRMKNESSWLWSYGSLTHNYLCNQCLSPLYIYITLWVRTLFRRGVLDTTLFIKFVIDLRQGRGFLRFPPPMKLSPTI